MTERVIPYFDLAQIAASGQCFRMNPAAGGGWVLIAGGRYLSARQEGERVFFSCGEEELEGFWRQYFDLDTDYGAFLGAVDPADAFLCAAANFGSGMRILRQDLWETTVTFLISQNNNIPRIKAAVERLCTGWGEKRCAPDGTVYYAFPTKQALAAAELDELRAAGLGYRDKYIQQAARGDIDFAALAALSPARAQETLTALNGVGNKVASCIRLFGLHDLAVFPVDTWIRKLCEQHYGGKFPLERYEGFAGVIQQYIFYYGRLGGSMA